MKNTKESKKSLIIAERIKLSFVIDLVLSVIFSVPLFCLLGVAIYFDIILLLVFVILCLIALATCITIEIVNVCKNNRLPPIMITYKDNCFTICDDLKIDKGDIIDMTFKNKKYFVFSTSFYSEQVWNYGTLILFIKDKESADSCYKLTLKNVAEPDKVFDKISHILEWDVIEEE